MALCRFLHEVGQMDEEGRVKCCLRERRCLRVLQVSKIWYVPSAKARWRNVCEKERERRESKEDEEEVGIFRSSLVRLTIPAGASRKASHFQRNLRRYDRKRPEIHARGDRFCVLWWVSQHHLLGLGVLICVTRRSKRKHHFRLYCVHPDALEEWLAHPWCLRVSIRSITLHTASVKASHSLQCSAVSAQALQVCKSACSEPSRGPPML